MRSGGADGVEVERGTEAVARPRPDRGSGEQGCTRGGYAGEDEHVHDEIFGAIPLSPEGAYWSGETTVGGRRLVRSLYVSDRLASEQSLLEREAALLDGLDGLDGLDSNARVAIATALEDRDDTVRSYIDFHLEELSSDELQRIFGKPREALDPATFLAKLELVGVALEPTTPRAFGLVLDYSLGRDVTDRVLAVVIDTSGEVVAVSHES